MSIIHYVGIDDAADRWDIAELEVSHGDHSERLGGEFQLVPNEQGYRKLIGFLKGLGGEVQVVYEAGPCGYELHRRLREAGIDCRVAAPSLTPKKPGLRVKTNRRDARKLASAARGNQLTYIAVPDRERESLRDLTRARQTAKADLLRTRHHITTLLLRYGQRYREGNAWTRRFWTWLGTIQLLGYSQTVLDELMAMHEEHTARIARLETWIEQAAQQPQYAPYLAALKTLRGVNTLTAMVILAELGDLRRFATAPQLMSALGVIPSEASTGETVRRFGITKTGNAHVRHVLVEAAWQYQKGGRPGRTIAARRKGQPEQIVAVARKCELRLHRKFTRMTARHKPSTIAAVAVARELAGFIWAIGQIVHP